MIGKKLSPVLEEIQDTLIEYNGHKPNFTDEGFKAAIFIFHTALMDKMYELQVREDMPQDQKEIMAESCGNATRNLIKTFTDIDTHELYKK